MSHAALHQALDLDAGHPLDAQQALPIALLPRIDSSTRCIRAQAVPGSGGRGDAGSEGVLERQRLTDISLGILIGSTSGESVQMSFNGDGWATAQPYEEASVAAR